MVQIPEALGVKGRPVFDDFDGQPTHADEGQQAEIIWTFDKPGTFEYGCLIPGHFEAGMKGTVYVETTPMAASGGVSHGVVGSSKQLPDEHLDDHGR